MAEKSRSGRRNNTNPEATRREILQAALEVLAKDGPESLSVTEVARRAGVNRGTAYQHFPTREELAHATASWVSERIYQEFYGDLEPGAVPSEDYPPDMAQRRLCNFAMDNPELSRAWWFDLMSTQGVVTDPFWQKYMTELEEFVKLGNTRRNVDTEIYAFIIMAGTMLWPIWVGAHARDSRARKEMQDRFLQEIMRMVLFGTLNTERFPELVERYGPRDGD